jgi:mono/diheme cytochrome c family protein
MIEFLGKFHPVLVHLPIGFFILLGALEWLALRPGWKELTTANRVILLLTIPASLASAICGWLLAAGAGYEANALFWHRWLGTTVVAAAIVLWIVRQRGWMTAYRRSLVATLILLTVASHFGGTLTHGSNFLAWPKQRGAGLAAQTEAELLAQPVYAASIQPLFNEYCVSCHGEQKIKGGLRLDTAEHLRKGGDSGSPLDPPGAEYSLLGNRLRLPVEDEDHMPPEGKPQLSVAQLAAVVWWLNAGAPTDQTTHAELKPTDEQLQLIRAASSTKTAPPLAE